MNTNASSSSNLIAYNKSLKVHHFSPLDNAATILWLVYAGWTIFNMVTPSKAPSGYTESPSDLQYTFAIFVAMVSLADIYFYPLVCRFVRENKLLSWVFLSPAVANRIDATNLAYQRRAKAMVGNVDNDDVINVVTVDDSDLHQVSLSVAGASLLSNTVRITLRIAIFMLFGFVLGPALMLFASDRCVNF